MTRFKLIIVLFSFYACHSIQEKDNHDSFGANEKVQWIQAARDLPSDDSLFYLDYPAPLFRKVFDAKEDIKSANLYITAAGYYKASVNGKPVGAIALDPAWTDYSKRIYYTVYDVSSLLNDGDNCLGVSLGNGFYNPLPLRKWGRRNLRNDLSVGKPTFLARLVINYTDGTTKEIASDTTWKYALGPMIKNDVYIGVAYDSRKEIPAWNTPGFDDSKWKSAIKGNDPGGKLEETFFPPVQVTEEITPIGISIPDPGIYVVDMGVNFTGSYKIKLTGNPGDTIKFRFGEPLLGLQQCAGKQDQCEHAQEPGAQRDEKRDCRGFPDHQLSSSFTQSPLIL